MAASLTSLKAHAERKAERTNDLDKLRELREAIRTFAHHVGTIQGEMSAGFFENHLQDLLSMTDALSTDGDAEIVAAMRDHCGVDK